MTPKVLYDADCLICRQLAARMAAIARGELSFESWQIWRNSIAARSTVQADKLKQPADKLRVWDRGRLIEGDAAWKFLLSRCPGLKTVDWIVRKINAEDIVAKTLKASGKALRGGCRGCGRNKSSKQ